MSSPTQSEVTAAIVELYKQWMIGATKPPTTVLPKASFNVQRTRNFNLKNRVKRRFLQHEDQTFGINIGWTDDGRNATGDKVARWFVARKGSGTGPITYGETVALGNGGKPSFVRYEERTFGINLGYSDKPVFEWKLLGGKKGTPVKTQDWIAIYNENSKSKECLVHFDRTVGGDIGWPSSKTWADQFGDLIKKELKDLMTKENLAKAAAALLL